MRPDLPETAYNRLPFPIAFHADRCQLRLGRSGPEPRVKRIGQCVESILRYLAMVSLADYLDHGAPIPDHNALLRRLLPGQGRGLMMGQWLEVARETVKGLASLGGTRPPELLDAFFLKRSNGLSPAPFLQAVSSLVPVRNADAHTIHIFADAETDRLYGRLADALARLAFLADYPLVVPAETSPGDARMVTQVYECMGVRSGFHLLPCAIDFPEEAGGPPHLHTHPVLLDPGRTRVLLDQYPLTLFHLASDEAMDDVYRYDSHETRGGGLARLEFHPNRVALEGLRINDRHPSAWVLRDFSRRLAVLFGTPALPDPTPEPDLPEMHAEIDRLHAGFAGNRQPDQEALDKALAGTGPGCVCFVGPEGVGKSAFAARLMRGNGWPGVMADGHGGRDQPARLTQSLLNQLARIHPRARPVPGDPGTLRDLFVAALHRLANDGRPGPTVLILDGVDRLSAEAFGELVPRGLPPRTFFVLFARPGPHLDGLRSLAGVPWTDLPLGNLGKEDSQAYLRSMVGDRTDAEIHEMVGASDGFPPLLQQIVACAQAGRPWATAVDELGARYRPAFDEMLTADEDGAYRLLAVLATYREPLTVKQMVRLTGGRSLHHARGLLRPLLPHLHRGIGERLFATGALRQAIRDEVPADVMEEARETLIEVLRLAAPADEPRAVRG